MSSDSRQPANAQPRGPVQQPKPQALPARPSSGASILVSPRQKGNPILNHIKGLPWEYTETPADFVVGATTCALFLSLKYHKLHPEYIYGRIRGLQGKYNLRILLVLVDIEAHEEALKELSKTSLINNVTIILSWSALEAGRYLELFKTYEHAAPTSIQGHQSTNFVDRLVEFTTVPRSVNKTDAVSLVSNFGTIRTAVNAQPEDIALIAGWGDKKVKRWCSAVREPFRSEKAAKKVLALDSAFSATTPAMRIRNGEESSNSLRQLESARPHAQNQGSRTADAEEDVSEEAIPADQPVGRAQTTGEITGKKRPAEPEMDEGVMAALAKLRKQG
jgi:DNA excision repair protein ERCC-1